MGAVWKDCLICGQSQSAVRLYQDAPFVLTTDDDAAYTFDRENAVSVFYFCVSDDERCGCGALYAVSYARTGDEAEMIAANLMQDEGA